MSSVTPPAKSEGLQGQQFSPPEAPPPAPTFLGKISNFVYYTVLRHDEAADQIYADLERFNKLCDRIKSEEDLNSEEANTIQTIVAKYREICQTPAEEGEKSEEYHQALAKFSTAMTAYEFYCDALKFDSTFLAKTIVDETGIIQEADDGNCFFHSLSDGLRVASNGEIDLNHQELREKIAHYVESHYQNDAILGLTLAAAIATYNEHLDQKVSDEKTTLLLLKEEQSITKDFYSQELKKLDSALENKISTPEEYIKRMGQPKFWGGTVEVYAVSMMYQYPIKVSYQQTGVEEILNPTESTKPTIEIVFTGDHFNLRVGQ